MFEYAPVAPPDPILGVTAAYQKDTNPNKINLSVGVYQDSRGRTPIFDVVKEAEKRRLESETSKAYLPIVGDPIYRRSVEELLFGKDSDIISDGRLVTAHSAGGTSALRAVGDYIHTLHRGRAVWVSDPSWVNHYGIFKAAGLEVKSYPYKAPDSNAIDIDGTLRTLANIPHGDVVIFHGCCHNPTGIDPTPEQWELIADVMSERGLIPLIDLAYQGFGDGLIEDTISLRTFTGKLDELIICSSFSKNLGLYRERTGAITMVCRNADQTRNVEGQLKLVIRTNYSTPPAHGAAIASQILQDPELKCKWENEVAGMRNRIIDMRHLFAKTMQELGVTHDFCFVTKQRGMFSLPGLINQQVRELRDKHSLYLVSSGRMSFAGMNEQNMGRICRALKSVL